MAKFKVGDKVKCISQGDCTFGTIIGDVYTVKQWDGVLFRLVELGTTWHNPDHFKLYGEPLPVWVNAHEHRYSPLGYSVEEHPHSHYFKDFGAYLDQETGRVMVDVYAVLDEFEVQEPELQHLAKKVLCLGVRGHKLTDEDLEDIIDSAVRLRERRQLKEEYSK